MPEYDAVKYNTPPTEQEIRNLQSQSLFRNPEAGVNELLKQFGYIEPKPMAQDTMNALINKNDNKDFFELMKGMMPSMDTVENFVPPVGLMKLLQLGQAMNTAPLHESQAFFKGLGESAFGEPAPVGPQGLPFSQFMQQKQKLDPKVKSIVDQHVNKLFTK